MSLTVECDRKIHDNNTDISRGNLESLEAIGQSLHPYLIPPPNHELYASSQNSYTNKQSITSLQEEDQTPLRAFVHGMSTGERFFKERSADEGNLHQREDNASFTAVDLIRTSKGGCRRGSKFKDLISDHLNIGNVSDHVRDLLGFVGLCRSRTYLSLSEDKAVNEKIKQGWSPEGRGYGLLAGAYDNMGMRKTKGYVQYTILAVLFYNVFHLIRLGIYPDPKSTDYAEAYKKCKSRETRNWEVVKYITDRMDPDFFEFEITKEDAQMLASEVTLPSIEFVLQAIVDKVLPSISEAKEFLDDTTDVTIDDASIPRAAVNRRSLLLECDSRGGDMTADVAQLELEESQVDTINDLDEDHLEDDEDEEETMYSKNNVTTDLPLRLDLNSTEGVMTVNDYYCGLVDRCLAGTTHRIGDKLLHKNSEGTSHGLVFDDELDEPRPAEASEYDWDELAEAVSEEENPWAKNKWPLEYWPEPFMHESGPWICGDGSPTYAMKRLHEKNPIYTGRKFIALNGGFHTMLETHKMRGRIFGPSHLRLIWELWRPTKAQLDWVMSPGDPNQVEDELVMYYLAVIASAVFALLDRRVEKNESIQGVSAMDVLKFMQEVAAECPIAQVVYNEIRFAEAVFLVQQAEEESNAAKFVTSLKFVSLLFTTNHATKYTHIAADFLAWWHCASDATQTIFEKVIMTRETRHGKTIFMDRFVEWIVKDMRSGVGKFYRRGTDAKIDRQAVLLSAKKEFKAVFAKEKGKEKTREVKSSRKLGRVFCLALKCLDDDELWKKRDINRLSLRPDKPELNYQMLDLPLLGEARMNTWIDVNMKGLGEENDQSTKDAQLLKRIQPTVEKRMADDKDDVECSTSTTVTFVLDKYTAA